MKHLTISFMIMVSLFSSHSLYAQSSFPAESGMKGIYDAGTISGSDTLKAVLDFIKQNASQIRAYPDGLKLNYYSQSPYTKHYQFSQTFAGIELSNASAVVNINQMGKVTSFFIHLINTANWHQSTLVSAAEQFPVQAALQKLSTGRFKNKHISLESKIVIINPDHPSVVLQVTYFDSTTSAYQLISIDKHLDLIENRDLHRYYYGDTTVSAKVFMPDPLTSAHKGYGGLYADNNDASNLLLSAERKTVSITVKKDIDTMRLESPYIKMVDLQPPFARPAAIKNGTFDFIRSESGFEDVNAYYHLNTMHDYLVQNLGFTGLAGFQVQVDAHGDVADNSYFVNNSPPRLILGIGGVDDGEDADVIIHEYGHGISYSANGNYNTSSERDALDEAFGDYLAASYSRSIDPFHWSDVFNWDGHNEYWNGRIVNSNAHYPDDLGSNIYLNGEIWSSVMMEIWTDLGRETSDKLMIESLYSWSENMTMKDAAMLILNADAAQNNGAHYENLFFHFYNRGLLDNIPTSISGTGPFLQDKGKLMLYVDQQAGNANLEIFDLQGRLIHRETDFSDKIMEIPRSWFSASGMYIARLRVDNNTVVQKFIYILH